MINSTSKTDSILRPDANLTGRQAQVRPAAVRTNDADTINVSSQATLQDALSSQPEVRPEVVERAKQLMVDANYPPKEIIRRLSEMLIKSDDPSVE